MDTRTLDRIKQLRDTAQVLKTFHTTYKNKYEPNEDCDKKGYGFSEDSRFRAWILR